MRNFLSIWRRELVSCFVSPIAYVVMIFFVGVSGGTFLLGTVRNTGSPDPLSSLMFGAVLLWLPVLATVITMRLFAEERRAGTIETLMTAPVSDCEVVLGKYAGAMSFLLIVVAPVIADVYVVAAFSPGISVQALDRGEMSGGCLILLLVSGLFVSIGLLISLLTRSQIIAAVCCLCALWVSLLLGWLVSLIPGVDPGMTDYISLTTHIQDFARGSVDIAPVVLHVSMTVFLLFFSVRILESRHWL